MRNKIVASAILAATIAIGSLFGAGTASAYTGNEVAFLNAMESGGSYIYDADMLVQSGYDICNQFNYRDGNQIAVDVFSRSSWADIPNLHEAQRWVNTAANTLCPWVWESGSVRAVF